MSVLQTNAASILAGLRTASSFRRAFVALVATAALSLALSSVAEAQQKQRMTYRGELNAKHHRVHAAYRGLYGSAQDPAPIAIDPAPMVRSPCGTAPEFCPNYFGSNGP
jgi:hypothetical protein